MKMLKQKKLYSCMIANITWNKYDWQKIYTDPRAGHKLVKNNPGHESLNFKFDKEVFDNDREVYGFIQWKGKPRFLLENAFVIFFSKNLDTKKGEFVGVYGNAKILKETGTADYVGFKNNQFQTNISAQKDLSVLFPVFLNAKNYSESKRVVPQSGFTYKDEQLAEKVIFDEIAEIEKSEKMLSSHKEEYEKLKKIYQLIAGNEYKK